MKTEKINGLPNGKNNWKIEIISQKIKINTPH